MMNSARQSCGVPEIDSLLGGGLLPGTLTVLVGATGIGKTQLGLQYAHAGLAQEGSRGVILDACARGDGQNQQAYAERMFAWDLHEISPGSKPNLADYYCSDRQHGDYLHVFEYQGRRVTRRDLEFEQWQAWQAELNSRLSTAISFLYGNLCRGTRRVVVDGIEPADRPSDSIQLNLFEYIYHQILRKEPEWVARDLFREHYRENAQAAAQHSYRPADVGCLLLYTSHETMLEDLITRRLNEGDVLSNANTIIYMGKIREGNRMSRALYVAKHRGSACDEKIAEFAINDDGLHLLDS
jgi:KaiC/GvpD/RAD55 family RecA-like ATPase